jgi:nicotinamide-nucleotide amidase
MSVRAGIVVTGTEVLQGTISDRNGPWLSEQLRDRGVTLAHILVTGDRRDDLRAALAFFRGLDLVITSGGLGPTADDLTAEVVAGFAGRRMAFDAALDERIWARVMSVRSRLAAASEEALREGARKQAFVPDGAVVLEPVGTAPGLLVPVPDGPLIVVLPGPPSELQQMWAAAVETSPLREILASAGHFEQRMLRFYGLPEPQIAATLRDLSPPDALEITTCLRGGELEVATVFGPQALPVYEAFADEVGRRHADTLFSPGGETVDELVAARLVSGGLTISTAESCTGGLMAGRLTELAGSSAYVLGGLVVYANEAKTALAGVPSELIATHGAVSPEVARALAAGARAALETDVGIGITGIAGPGGGSPEKPVGTVCLCVSTASELRERTVRLPGDRANVRERTTTVAMHMLLALLG